MTVRDDRGDVKQTTTGFRGPLMVQSLTSAKSKFLSLERAVWKSSPFPPAPDDAVFDSEITFTFWTD